jgi:hypothetical protein
MRPPTGWHPSPKERTLSEPGACTPCNASARSGALAIKMTVCRDNSATSAARTAFDDYASNVQIFLQTRYL